MEEGAVQKGSCTEKTNTNSMTILSQLITVIGIEWCQMTV